MAITSTNQNNGLNPTGVIIESFQYLKNQHPDISIEQMETLFEKELINQIKNEICRYNLPRVIPERELLKWRLQKSRTPKKKIERRESQIILNKKVRFYLAMQDVIKSSKIEDRDFSFVNINKDDIVEKEDSIIHQEDFCQKEEILEEIESLKLNILKNEEYLPINFENNLDFSNIHNQILDFSSDASKFTESTLFLRDFNQIKNNGIKKGIVKNEEKEMIKIIEIDSIIEEIINYKPKRFTSQKTNNVTLLDLIDIANN
ncbi:hypothetical protein [Candidatus Harpocratesius sp.]